jgi:hypothetical protein
LTRKLRSRLGELDAWERLVEDFPQARVRRFATVDYEGERLPIEGLCLGPEEPSTPTLALLGGVHGLERIGTQVLLAYLESLKVALGWDVTLNALFERVRLVALPLVNPVGTALGLRSNGNGVDLMRNAPVEAEAQGAPFDFYRGQRLTRFLPWFRGSPNKLEVEADAVCTFVREEVYPSAVSVTVDIHSGFLATDRVWFPYARSKQPLPSIGEVAALRTLLRETHPYHHYRFEPQSVNYTTHGDLWDYLYDEHRARFPTSVMLPLTLELSSTTWYRKNPRQLLRRVGLFYPLAPKRLAKVLHKHKTLFEFLLRALCSRESWLPRSKEHHAALVREAMELWFDENRSK